MYMPVIFLQMLLGIRAALPRFAARSRQADLCAKLLADNDSNYVSIIQCVADPDVKSNAVFKYYPDCESNTVADDDSVVDIKSKLFTDADFNIYYITDFDCQSD